MEVILSSHEIPLSTGVDFVGNAIKIAMDEEINIKDLTPKFSQKIFPKDTFFLKREK